MVNHMKDEYFVNEAVESAIKMYIDSRSEKLGVIYNSFLVVVVRILALIYGELDILNPFYVKDSVAFISNLGKYGMSKSDIALFKEELLSYKVLEEENENRQVKLKNEHFKNILKYLVDMFVAKSKSVGVNFQDEEEFLELAYTSHTTNPVMVSYNYLVNDDVTYIERYYYSRINDMEMTKDLSKTISSNINLEALKYVGVGIDAIKSMNEEELQKQQEAAYKYFEVDAASPTRDENLRDSINSLNNYMPKDRVTSGNGYVDILLLMSVIGTSMSIIAIIIFSFM